MGNMEFAHDLVTVHLLIIFLSQARIIVNGFLLEKS
jgi:hypothetical protein